MTDATDSGLALQANDKQTGNGLTQTRKVSPSFRHLNRTGQIVLTAPALMPSAAINAGALNTKPRHSVRRSRWPFARSRKQHPGALHVLPKRPERIELLVILRDPEWVDKRVEERRRLSTTIGQEPVRSSGRSSWSSTSSPLSSSCSAS
jgi:hypothetical protein